MLSDEMRKTLTEKVLEECFHEGMGRKSKSFTHHDCQKCHIFPVPDNRTFTTVPDLHAVYRKIWERDEWEDFLRYCYRHSGGELNIGDDGDVILYSTSVAWLFFLDTSQIPERLAMVAGWIELKKEDL